MLVPCLKLTEVEWGLEKVMKVKIYAKQCKGKIS